MGFFLYPGLVLVPSTAAFWCLLMSPANDPPPRFRTLSALPSDEHTHTHADPRVSYSSAQTLSDFPVTLSAEEREEV